MLKNDSKVRLMVKKYDNFKQLLTTAKIQSSHKFVSQSQGPQDRTCSQNKTTNISRKV